MRWRTCSATRASPPGWPMPVMPASWRTFDLRTNTRRLAERFVAVARAAGRDVSPLPPETRDQAEPPWP